MNELPDNIGEPLTPEEICELPNGTSVILSRLMTDWDTLRNGWEHAEGVTHKDRWDKEEGLDEDGELDEEGEHGDVHVICQDHWNASPETNTDGWKQWGFAHGWEILWVQDDDPHFFLSSSIRVYLMPDEEEPLRYLG